MIGKGDLYQFHDLVLLSIIGAGMVKIRLTRQNTALKAGLPNLAIPGSSRSVPIQHPGKVRQAGIG